MVLLNPAPQLMPPFEVPTRREGCEARQKLQAGSHPPKCCLSCDLGHPTASFTPRCV